MGSANAGRRVWAALLKRFALDLTVVFIIGIVWEQAFEEPYNRNGLMAGVWAILIYLVVSISLLIINSLSSLAYLAWFGGSDMEEGALTDLRNSNLPGPRRHHAKRFDYLIEIADDSSEDVNVRIRAAALHAAYQVAIQRSGFFGGMALAKALDEATLRFSAEAPE